MDSASSCLQVFLETGTMTFLPNRPLSHGGSTRWRESASSPSWANAADWTRGPGGKNLRHQDEHERSRSESASHYVFSAAKRADCRGSGGFREYPRAHNLWIETGVTPPSQSPGAAQYGFDWEIHHKAPSAGTWDGMARQHVDGEHLDRRWQQYQQYRGLWVEQGAQPPPDRTRGFPPTQSQQPSPNAYSRVVTSALSQCDLIPPILSHFSSPVTCAAGQRARIPAVPSTQTSRGPSTGAIAILLSINPWVRIPH